jgi:putative endonuclease
MFWTYIVASKRNGTIYTGHTDDLVARGWQHRIGVGSRFTTKYGCTLLVWFEGFETREGAITREKRIKEWRRAWKVALIERANPDWQDLYEAFVTTF